MRNSLHLKIYNKACGLLLTIASLLCLSQTAVAETYYVWAGTNNNPAQFSKVGVTEDGSITITDSKYLKTGTNIYVIFTTKSGNSASDVFKDNNSDCVNAHIKCKSCQKGAGPISSVGPQEGYGYKFLRFSFSDVPTSFTVTISEITSDTPKQAKYTIDEARCSGLTVTPSVANGTISPSLAQCVTSGSDVAFTVTPKTGYEMPSSVTFSGTADVSISDNTITLSNVTAGGTLTVTCPEEPKTCKYYFRHKFDGSEWSNKEATLRSVGGKNVYVLEGVNYYGNGNRSVGVDISLNGNDQGKYFEPGKDRIEIDSRITDGALCIFTFTPDLQDNCYTNKDNIAGTVKITKVVPTTLPVVRIGNKTTQDDASAPNPNVNVSAYLAKTGCSAVTKFTIYYCKNSFSETTETGVFSKEIEASSPEINTLTTLKLPIEELLANNWDDGDKVYVRITATTEAGESELSDMDNIVLDCEKNFKTTNLDKTFSACATGHQFNLSEMVTPTPTKTVITTKDGVSAQKEFTISDGVVVWSVDGRITGSVYEYVFSFSKTGYPDASANITITYQEDAPSGTISIIEPAADGTNTYPWTPVALVAQVEGDFNSVEWSSTPSAVIVNGDYDSENKTYSATFKGKAPKSDSETYTVTVKGMSATCGSSTATRTIIVNKDVEECTDAN